MQNFRVLTSKFTDIFNFLPERQRKKESEGPKMWSSTFAQMAKVELKCPWEFLTKWQNKFLKYCSTKYTETQALEDAAYIRYIIYVFSDDHILSRIEKKLQEAKTVTDLFQTLKARRRGSVLQIKDTNPS